MAKKRVPIDRRFKFKIGDIVKVHGYDFVGEVFYREVTDSQEPRYKLALFPHGRLSFSNFAESALTKY